MIWRRRRGGATNSYKATVRREEGTLDFFKWKVILFFRYLDNSSDRCLKRVYCVKDKVYLYKRLNALRHTPGLRYDPDRGNTDRRWGNRVRITIQRLQLHIKRLIFLDYLILRNVVTIFITFYKKSSL